MKGGKLLEAATLEGARYVAMDRTATVLLPEPWKKNEKRGRLLGVMRRALPPEAFRPVPLTIDQQGKEEGAYDDPTDTLRCARVLTMLEKGGACRIDICVRKPSVMNPVIVVRYHLDTEGAAPLWRFHKRTQDFLATQPLAQAEVLRALAKLLVSYGRSEWRSMLDPPEDLVQECINELVVTEVQQA